MIITNISFQKKDKKRLSVFVDGEYRFSVHENTYMNYYLKKGQKLTDDQIEEITQYDKNQRAYEASLNLVNYRDRTRKEIKDKLTLKGFDSEQIVYAVNKCVELGLINELEYAKYFIEIRMSSWSRQKIILKLSERGIMPEITEEIMNGIDPEYSEFDKALNEINRVKRRWDRLDYESKRNKVYNYLSYRHFSYDIIIKVIDNIYKEVI